MDPSWERIISPSFSPISSAKLCISSGHQVELQSTKVLPAFEYWKMQSRVTTTHQRNVSLWTTNMEEILILKVWRLTQPRLDSFAGCTNEYGNRLPMTSTRMLAMSFARYTRKEECYCKSMDPFIILGDATNNPIVTPTCWNNMIFLGGNFQMY